MHLALISAMQQLKLYQNILKENRELQVTELKLLIKIIK
jgi:hypothetical protein